MSKKHNYILYLNARVNKSSRWWKMVVNLGGGSGGYICMGRMGYGCQVGPGCY